MRGGERRRGGHRRRGAERRRGRQRRRFADAIGPAARERERC